MEIEKVKYYIIEMIIKDKNKRDLLKTLNDSLCFVVKNVE